MSDSFKVKKSDVVARMVKLAIDDEFEELSNLSDSLSEYNEFYHTVTLSAFYQEELSHWVRTYGEPIRDEPAPDGDRLSGYFAKFFSGFDSDWQFAIPKPPDTEPGLGDNVSTKTDDSNKRTGCSCAECKAFNEYGEPNQPNGQYVCYACRENLAWKYR